MVVSAAMVQAEESSVAAVPASNSSASLTPPAPGTAGTVTGTVDVSKAKKSPLGASFYTYTTVGKKSANDSNPAADQYLRLTGKYSLSDTKSISVYGQFTYKFATQTDSNGPGRTASGNVDDTVLQYTDSKLVSLPADWNLVMALRAYLPTGEQARFVTKRAGMGLGIFSFEKSFGKLDISEAIYTFFHNQTQDYYLSGTTIKANADYEFDQALELEYHFTDKFSVSNAIGTEHMWARGVPIKGVERTTAFYNELQLILKPTAEVTLRGALITEQNMDSQNAFSAFQDDNTSYRTYLTIAI
jgi:hypothetical protein